MRGVLTAVVFALLLGAGAAQAQDTTPPTLVAGTFAGDEGNTTVKLYFSENLNTTFTLRTDAFTVSSPATLGTMSLPEFDLSESESHVVIITFSAEASDTQTASISIGDGAVRDTSGNLLKPVSGFELTNVHEDNAPGVPTLSTAVVNGDTLTLTYNQNLLPRFLRTGVFTVTVTPTPDPLVTVSSLTINRLTSTAVLTLSTAVKATDDVKLTYDKETSDHGLQNEWGNQAAEFTDQAVTNNTPPAATIVVKNNTNTITEGAEAEFTVALSPAPTEEVRVNLEIKETGSTYVVSGGLGDKNVDVAASETTKDYTVETVDDSTDEPNGTVTATLKTGTGYTVGATNSATVTVNDNDAPVASITRNVSAVTEGTGATFTVTLSSALTKALTVNLAVTETGSTYVVSGGLGDKTVDVTASSTTATYTVGTVDDSTDEESGEVTVTVRPPTPPAMDYTVASEPGNSATVTVNDDDNP